jgi:hypothetical protein
MARTEGNVFVDGFRGKVGGNMVFRKRKSGKLIIAKNKKKSTLPPTEEQLKIRDTFKEAVIYAKAVMQNAPLKAMYDKAVKGDQSAYNLALRDFAKAPEIKSLNTADYSGQPGGAIVVRATDDFKVTSVKVAIYSPAGILLEEGEAAINANGLDWTYKASVINNEVAGSSIKAIVLDTPGNRGSLEAIL